MAGEEEDWSVFLGLADEVIDIIFSKKLLDHKDLCRCSEVCTRFYVICRNPELWRKKALQRWEFWKHSPTVDWLECFKQRTLTENYIMRFLHKLTENNYTKVEVSKKEFKELECMIDQKEAVLDYAKDTLLQILESNPRKANLTDRYYAGKVMAHVKCHELLKQWKHFLSRPEEDQHLEEGAVLITKWVQCNPEIDEAEVGQELDKIADLARSCYAEHSAEESASNINAGPVDRKMFNAIQKVLFQDLKFSGNSDDYYNIANSLIDKVLKSKTGNPISLSVVFAAIARRLGVTVEPVNFPGHFLLRWKNAMAHHTFAQTFTYIDCFRGGEFMSQDECLDEFMPSRNSIISPQSIFTIASPTQVFSRIMANIINSYRTSQASDNGLSGLRNALELLLFLKPNDSENQYLRARIFVHLGIDLQEAITNLEALKNLGGHPRQRLLGSLLERAKEKQREVTLEEATLRRKLRSDQENAEVAYKVGMVMRHRRFHYGCVIYGWDPVCVMDEGWIHQMGVDDLQNGRHQPFYNVFGDDGSCRYASQESLCEEPLQEFNPHPELGKHFKAFTGTRYIPNKSLQERYPEDMDDNI